MGTESEESSSIIRDNRGMAQPVFGFFALLFLLVMMSFILNICAYKAISDRLEDALAASGLAACVINIEQYGIDHSIIIDNAEEAYERYKETLDINLNLKNGSPKALSFIEGPVRIENFRVYNVRGGTVTEIVVGESGVISTGNGRLGEFCAPNGQIIENTGIYSEISFPISGRFGRGIMARKSKLTAVDTFSPKEGL